MTRTAVLVGMLVVGLGFVAGAGYVWMENDLAHYGQGTYAITGMGGSALEPTSTVPENASVIAYSDLPPKAQRAFDKARQGQGNTLWSKDDRRAVEALLPYSTGYVEYRGEYYQILILSGHRGQQYWWRGLLMFIGSAGIGLALIGAGVRELLRNRAER